nr:hypothetical protein [Pseudomonas jessenii]
MTLTSYPGSMPINAPLMYCCRLAIADATGLLGTAWLTCTSNSLYS